MLEYEKYHELQLKSQRMQEDYEQQLHSMEKRKYQALEDLTFSYETKLQEKQLVLTQVCARPVETNGNAFKLHL